MNRLVICPSERPAVGLLGQKVPLCCLSLLGQGLIEYWLGHLAASGVTSVAILATDRPKVVERLVGAGTRWGITVQVMPEARELTPPQALLKHECELDVPSAPDSIVTLDHFPGLPQHPLFFGYDQFFSAMLAWMPQARTVDRVGIKEIQPGVWIGSHARISRKAELVPPCWIGQKAFVGPGATIGPAAVVEERSFIEGKVCVTQSYIGADTFVGRYSEIKGSLALGNLLINWATGSWAEVPDPFLLCSLRRPRLRESEGWVSRLREIYERDAAHIPMAWKHFLLKKES